MRTCFVESIRVTVIDSTVRCEACVDENLFRRLELWSVISLRSHLSLFLSL